VQIVEMPVNSSTTSSIAIAVGIVSIVAVIAVVIFAAVMKIRKRGGSHAFGTEDLEYSKLME
jgi:hypothetical protein